MLETFGTVVDILTKGGGWAVAVVLGYYVNRKDAALAEINDKLLEFATSSVASITNLEATIRDLADNIKDR